MPNHSALKSRSRLILNFLPIGTGGGLQNALSFLVTLSEEFDRKKNCLAIVRRNSHLQTLCENVGIKHIAVDDKQTARFAFEMGYKSVFRQGEVCFTLFGPPMFRSRGYLLNIVGCAYSNLFYPEIPFWSFLPLIQKMKKEIIDILRRRVTAWADYWIFETEILRRRAIKLCHFPMDRVGVVRMAPSQLVKPEQVKMPLREELRKRLPQGFKILYLSDAHPNKRINLLPEISRSLIAKGFNNFCFVTTMPPNAAYARETLGKFDKMCLQKHVANVGPVDSDNVATVIDSCDAMCTFSVLESFSNNFVEAWQMGKPLIVTDADWARDACGAGALYTDPTNANSTAFMIRKLAIEDDFYENIIKCGKAQLKTYPNAQEKNRLYFEEIDKAVKLGSCSSSERRRISWPHIL